MQSGDDGGDGAVTSVWFRAADYCAVGGFYRAIASFALGFVASGALPQTSRSALTLSAATLTYSREQRERITVTVSLQRTGKPSGTVTVRTGSVGYVGSGSATEVVTVVR